MGINVKRRLYEVVVLTTQCGAKTWSMEVAEKKRLNAMEMSEQCVV